MFRRRPAARWPAIALAAVFAFAGPGRPLPAAAATAEDKQLDESLAFARQVIARYGLVRDHAVELRLNRIGYAVAAQAGLDGAPVVFYAVQMEDPNAFALPGGFVFVTSAMLDLGLSDDELAALLGHEIVHVQKRHSQRMERKATLLGVLNTLLLAGAIAGSRGSRDRDASPFDVYDVAGVGGRDTRGDMIQAAAAAGAVLQELLLRGYSRDFEVESDAEGMRAAANAGFDPQGGVDLVANLHEQIFEIPGAGYWRSHPYFDDRIRAAGSRVKFMRAAAPPPDASAYREAAAARLMAAAERAGRDPAEADILRFAALTAWPLGARAHRLREGILARALSRQLGRDPLLADYGELGRLHRDAIAEIRAIAPDDPEARRLEERAAGLREEAALQYPEYDRSLDLGAGETGFYERFLSNYPEAPRTAEVAARLGDNYRLSRREADAVPLYLQAMCADESGPWGGRARAGLEAMVPELADLSAAYEVAVEVPDERLAQWARARVEALAGTFTVLADGASFLRAHPVNPFRAQVETRLSALAEKAYGEAILYKGIGDAQTALDRYNDVLANAPASPAAQRIRDSIIEGK